MARTLIDLDRELLEKAKAALGTKTITATVHEGLRRIVAEHAHRQFWDAMTDLDDEQRDALERAKDSW